MIACIWRGITQASQAERYLDYLNGNVIPTYQADAGNKGIFVLKDIQGELAHFLLLSFWDSKEALINFAGQDSEILNQSPESEEYLIAYESMIKKYQVVSLWDPGKRSFIEPSDAN
jgi:heme-degrading monooxygenase HmoA